MRQMEMQRVLDGLHELTPIDRQQHAAETPGHKPIGEIGEAVEDENPHAEEVPLQPVLRPFADGEVFGEMQPTEDDLVVVNLPAAADHDENGDRVGPVHDAQRQRMKLARVKRHGRNVLGLKLMHEVTGAAPRGQSQPGQILVASP